MFGAQIHMRAGLNKGRHVVMQLVMAEIHHGQVIAGTKEHGQTACPEGRLHFFGLDPLIRQRDRVAAIIVDCHVRPVLAHGAGMLFEPAQAADEAEGDGIVVIKAELHGGHRVLSEFRLDSDLHREAVLHRFALDDLDLRHMGGQVVQAVAVAFGQAVTDHHQKGEVGMLLRGDGGQGEAFKMAKAQVHPGRRIEIGFAVRNGVVHPLEAADSRVGESANPDHAHGSEPSVGARVYARFCP
ncbi:30S ribosomal protein S12 [Roseovarius sp. 217]|nr:30S ribosomal protein S12 [Roseovarius sp. 217]